MTRKALTVKLTEAPDDDRDRGKVFVLTEMDALAAWKWGIKALGAMVRHGAEIPDEITKMGIIGVLALGVFRIGYIPWPDLEPLLDELMTCVAFMPDPTRPDVTRKLFPGDIEEPTTYNRLAQEVFALHTGFFPGGDRSTYRRPRGPLPDARRSNTRTSRQQSAPSSPMA